MAPLHRVVLSRSAAHSRPQAHLERGRNSTSTIQQLAAVTQPPQSNTKPQQCLPFNPGPPTLSAVAMVPLSTITTPSSSSRHRRKGSAPGSLICMWAGNRHGQNDHFDRQNGQLVPCSHAMCSAWGSSTSARHRQERHVRRTTHRHAIRERVHL